jgi:hypothetical protein
MSWHGRMHLEISGCIRSCYVIMTHLTIMFCHTGILTPLAEMHRAYMVGKLCEVMTAAPLRDASWQCNS